MCFLFLEPAAIWPWMIVQNGRSFQLNTDILISVLFKLGAIQGQADVGKYKVNPNPRILVPAEKHFRFCHSKLAHHDGGNPG